MELLVFFTSEIIVITYTSKTLNTNIFYTSFVQF
jgi:hypothetical protein